MKLSLPRGFNKMSEDEQRKYVAGKLKLAQEALDYWAKQSRQLVYGKITVLDYERPDLEAMKDNNAIIDSLEPKDGAYAD